MLADCMIRLMLFLPAQRQHGGLQLVDPTATEEYKQHVSIVVCEGKSCCVKHDVWEITLPS